MNIHSTQFDGPIGMPTRDQQEALNKALREQLEPADMVNHPAHYASGNIECIDAIAEATRHLNGILAVCTGNAIKYLWRWSMKGGVEDLKKARWYIDRMINELEQQ